MPLGDKKKFCVLRWKYTKSEKWYFVTKIVLTFLRSLEQFVQTVKGQPKVEFIKIEGNFGI